MSESKEQKEKKKTYERIQLKFFNSFNVLLPYIREAARAAREPNGNAADTVSFASSFLQVQEEISQRLVQFIH